MAGNHNTTKTLAALWGKHVQAGTTMGQQPGVKRTHTTIGQGALVYKNKNRRTDESGARGAAASTSASVFAPREKVWEVHDGSLLIKVVGLKAGNICRDLAIPTPSIDSPHSKKIKIAAFDFDGTLGLSLAIIIICLFLSSFLTLGTDDITYIW